MKLYETKIVKTDSLKPADYNPRTISKDEFEGLKNSLDGFGLLDDIVINTRTGHIVSGHQRYEAAKALGEAEVTIKEIDVDLKTEQKINVLMNSPAIQGKFDDLKLSEILETLKLDDDYESLRLDKLEPLDLSDFDDINSTQDREASDKTQSVTCPECGHGFEV